MFVHFLHPKFGTLQSLFWGMFLFLTCENVAPIILPMSEKVLMLEATGFRLQTLPEMGAVDTIFPKAFKGKGRDGRPNKEEEVGRPFHESSIFSLGIQSPSENGFMEPKYHPFRR